MKKWMKKKDITWSDIIILAVEFLSPLLFIFIK